MMYLSPLCIMNYALNYPSKDVSCPEEVVTKQFQKCLSFLDQSPDVKDIIPRALNILMGARQTLYENLN